MQRSAAPKQSGIAGNSKYHWFFPVFMFVQKMNVTINQDSS
jgi:hypothetical protein